MKKQLRKEKMLLLAMLSLLILVCNSCSGKQSVLKDGEVTLMNDGYYSVPANQFVELMECCEICTEDIK